MPPVLVPFSVSPATVGDAVQLSCLATRGDSPMAMSWFAESHGRYWSSYSGRNRLPPGVTLTELSDRASLLVIPRVAPYHHGNYTCYVWNYAGDASLVVQLIVNGMFRFYFVFSL